MPEPSTELHTPPVELEERRITLSDGRYMVFFTFNGGVKNADPADTLKEEQSSDV